MTDVRTSATDPIVVHWLPAQQGSGRVGLTIAPGKHAFSKSGARWERDLRADLAVLREEFHADVLVCLLRDEEMARLRIPTLVADAEAAGLEVHRLPIHDGGVLPSTKDAEATVSAIVAASRAGRSVVIHCQGGLGRAGTIGGCYLRACGVDADAALRALVATRGRHCPETDAQREFIRAFR